MTTVLLYISLTSVNPSLAFDFIAEMMTIALRGIEYLDFAVLAVLLCGG